LAKSLLGKHKLKIFASAYGIQKKHIPIHSIQQLCVDRRKLSPADAAQSKLFLNTLLDFIVKGIK
jgi:hypothetical protein